MRRTAPVAGFATGLILISLLVPLGASPRAAALGDYDWTKVYVPGQPIEDGMLVGDRIIVEFRPGSVPAPRLAKGGELVTGQIELDRLGRRFGVRRFDRLFAPVAARQKAAQPPQRARIFAVDFDPAGRSLREVAAAYSALPGVDHVEPVAIHFTHANLPNDPALDLQWWLRNRSSGGADIRALAAWYHSTGSANVLVVAADTGVDWQHPDLGGTAPDYTDGVIWTNAAELGGTPGVDDDGNGKVDDFRGWDFVNVSDGTQTPPQDIAVPDNDPMDYGGHGTWVSGCMSAISNNGVGVASTNWNAKILACRIGWTPSTGPSVVRMDFAAQALDYARIVGADVFNASWGSSGNGGLVAATNQAIAAGMVIVTSAGNSNDQIASYLAGRSDVVAVAATNSTDAKASFSSYGPWVDISAPGVGIYTTGFNVNGTGAAAHVYGAPDGTSFSSPIVAGAFALAKAIHPTFSRTQLVNTVLAAVDDIDGVNPSFVGKLGSGRLNLAKFFSFPRWEVPEHLPTLLDAMNVADVGDTIAVLGGLTFTDRITLQSKGLQILGGWDATYTTRDPVGNPAIFDPGGGSGSVLSVPAGVDSTTVFDGFVIRGGRASQFSSEPVLGRYGGGIVVRGGSPLLRNLRVENCIAGLSTEFGAGGGAAVLGGSPLFEDCEFTANTALRGPAIYVHQGSPTFRNLNIHDNTTYAAGAAGTPLAGAVYLVNVPSIAKRAAGMATFEGGVISGHVVGGSGGAIYAENSAVSVTGMTLENNQAGESGGAIYIGGGSYTGSSNIIRNNQASGASLTDGGGLYATGSAVSIQQSRYEGNRATFSGSGISIAQATTLSVGGSFVVGNNGGFVGTGVSLDTLPAGAQFIGNTVANNRGASVGANGLYLSGSGSLDVTNNIFAFNGGGGTTFADGVHCTGATAVFSCNDAFGNDAGNYGGCPDPTGASGNISADPQFCDLAGGDFSISSASVAASGQTGCGRMGAGAESCTPTAVEDGPGRARVLALAQNHPNPFNPVTSIAFDLPGSGAVSLRIFDLRGRVVRVLVDGPLEAGRHVVRWDGRDGAGRGVASGAYFYELRAGGQHLVRKMGLLK